MKTLTVQWAGIPAGSTIGSTQPVFCPCCGIDGWGNPDSHVTGVELAPQQGLRMVTIQTVEFSCDCGAVFVASFL